MTEANNNGVQNQGPQGQGRSAQGAHRAEKPGELSLEPVGLSLMAVGTSVKCSHGSVLRAAALSARASGRRRSGAARDRTLSSTSSKGLGVSGRLAQPASQTTGDPDRGKAALGASLPLTLGVQKLGISTRASLAQ